MRHLLSFSIPKSLLIMPSFARSRVRLQISPNKGRELSVALPLILVCECDPCGAGFSFGHAVSAS